MERNAPKTALYGTVLTEILGKLVILMRISVSGAAVRWISTDHNA
jgi:hypothetical protein